MYWSYVLNIFDYPILQKKIAHKLRKWELPFLEVTLFLNLSNILMKYHLTSSRDMEHIRFSNKGYYQKTLKKKAVKATILVVD